MHPLANVSHHSLRSTTLPFVGRRRELRSLRRLLDEGRSVVLTGPFGSGRSTLVGALADRSSDGYVFIHSDASRARWSDVVTAAAQPARDGRPLVVVWDDIVKVTNIALARMRSGLRRLPIQVIAIVERSVPSDQVQRLRAMLGAARLFTLGPLSTSEALRLFVAAAEMHRLPWTQTVCAGLAQASHGFLLGIMQTIACAERHQRERTAAVDASFRCPQESCSQLANHRDAHREA